jgi:toxin ParE1/3/4
MIRVIVSPRAQNDLTNILQFLAQDAGPRVAFDYREQFRSLYRLLSDHPNIGPSRPRFGRGVRVSLVHPYLAIYRHSDHTVTVLRIVHGRRKITGAMISKER